MTAYSTHGPGPIGHQHDPGFPFGTPFWQQSTCLPVRSRRYGARKHVLISRVGWAGLSGIATTTGVATMSGRTTGSVVRGNTFGRAARSCGNALT